jgi:hypothetical protein
MICGLQPRLPQEKAHDVELNPLLKGIFYCFSFVFGFRESWPQFHFGIRNIAWLILM